MLRMHKGKRNVEKFSDMKVIFSGVCDGFPQNTTDIRGTKEFSADRGYFALFKK